MGTWAWFVGAAAVGGAIGYIGFFAKVEGLSGALVGALIGLGAMALQHLKERRGQLGPERAKPAPLLAAPSVSGSPATPGVAVSAERNRRVLWRRSKPAKYSRWLFFYGGLTVFFALGILIARPDQMGYGLIPLGLLGIGVYKRTAAKREIARAMEILERGVAGEARVLSLDREAIRDSKTPIEFTLGWFARYSYRDGRGFTHTGESGFLPRREAERYRPGDVVMIVIDPADPGFSVWAEPCSVEPGPMVTIGRLPIA